jgi:hypothetical protein
MLATEVVSMSERNVLGTPLESCSMQPLTGWFRDGCCRTEDNDRGIHTVCCRVTEAFLMFSLARGNDLSTPRPELGFPGLNPGDQWCLCATRWREAFLAGAAPHVVLQATHEKTLEHVELEHLLGHAIGAEA